MLFMKFFHTMVRRDHIIRNVKFLTELDRYTFFSCRQSIIMNLYGKIWFFSYT